MAFDQQHLAGFFFEGKDRICPVAVRQADKVEAGSAIGIVEDLIDGKTGELGADGSFSIFGGGHDKGLVTLQGEALEKVAFDVAHAQARALLGGGEEIDEAVGGVRPIG